MQIKNLSIDKSNKRIMFDKVIFPLNNDKYYFILYNNDKPIFLGLLRKIGTSIDYILN